jgi:heat shock protein HslJ
MQYSKRFLLLTLLAVFSILAFGCQSEGTQEPEATDTPVEEKPSEVEPSGIQPVEIDEITNITWLWAELTENDPAAQSIVPDPENYTLTFWSDDTFSIKADCNLGNGTYTVEDSKIEFGPMMSTMAMCPPESLHDQYLALLDQVQTFGVSNDRLVLTLKEDAGEMRFSNSGPTEKPEALPEEPEAPTPEEKTLFVGPEKVDCVGVGPMECFQVKEDPDGEWQLFYDQIEGFEWEPGYTYELRVAVHQVENPPADASSLRYELIEVVDKVETPVEPEQTKAYIRIEKPLANAELDASKSIIVSGMGAGLFEGNVVVQIQDAEGNELALQPTILQSPDAGIGGEGPWETEINLSIEAPTVAKIMAFCPSPKDGEGWIASDEILVSLHAEIALDANLENTSWILRSFAQQEDIDSLTAVYQVTALFDPEDGTISGTAGCNNYFSSYVLDGDQLTIKTPVGATRMMCPEPQMVLENAYLAALEEVASFEITHNSMVVHDAKGNPLLVFQVDPYTLSESYTRDELANTSYLNEFAEVGIAQLTNGLYREPITEDSASELVVVLTNYAAFGDVSGDETENAVVVLVSQPGGSGSFYDLAVVRKQGEAITNMARIQLGDRVQIKSLLIENGEIVINMLIQGPGDPMCCPTQYVSNHYVLQSGELVLISSEVVE